MPRASGIKQLIAPSAGLITEQSKLTPVEGSTIDELNFTFNDDGSIRQRRKGLNKEEDANFFSYSETINDTNATSYGVWEAVEGDGDLLFHVFQIGATLFFIKDESGNLSSQRQDFTFDLDTAVTPAYTSVEDSPVSMSSGEGKLFIVGQKIEPFYLSYDPDTETITSEYINIRIRDLTGLDDGYEVDERPAATLSEEHEYNLNNQGWWQQRRIIAAGTFEDPIDKFEDVNGVYPSNADISMLGMVDDGDGNIIYDPDYLLELTLGNTPAPKGHFVINPFDIDYESLRDGSETGGGGYGGGAGAGGGTGGGGSGYTGPDWWVLPTNPGEDFK